ncbi:hypothetical protein M6B38_315860 [Iris pallida]|uniref:Uncharacterized protein n=1 Tax=Iris pallida TaxID=29817 RepID=A0AAX6HDM0_IRIPA|nr:hypothetical protein M6B38_315860 [Iris pallida]
MLYLSFILYHDDRTRFCSKEGLQPQSLFGLRVVTRLSNGSQVTDIFVMYFIIIVSYSIC